MGDGVVKYGRRWLKKKEFRNERYLNRKRVERVMGIRRRKVGGK